MPPKALFRENQRPVRAIGQPVDHQPAAANIASLLIDNGKRKITATAASNALPPATRTSRNLRASPCALTTIALSPCVSDGPSASDNEIVKLEGNNRCKQCQHCTDNNCYCNAVRFSIFRSLYCVRHYSVPAAPQYCATLCKIRIYEDVAIATAHFYPISLKRR